MYALQSKMRINCIMNTVTVMNEKFYYILWVMKGAKFAKSFYWVQD